MNKEKLKSCPHCGGEAKKEKYSGVMIYTAIECVNCFCGTGHEESEEEAIEAWNKRTPDIVYCRECVHNRAIAVTELKSNWLVGCSICMHNMPLDGYCSNGRRKEG